jgi:signal transduction histidine kinase
MPANTSKETAYDPGPISGNLGLMPPGVANIVHEITNPLTNLSLTLQLLERRLAKMNEHADPLVLSMLHQMTNEIDRMHFLISSVRATLSESKVMKGE